MPIAKPIPKSNETNNYSDFSQNLNPIKGTFKKQYCFSGGFVVHLRICDSAAGFFGVPKQPCCHCYLCDYSTFCHSLTLVFALEIVPRGHRDIRVAAELPVRRALKYFEIQ